MHYTAAAANNDWTTKIYLENDILDEQEILSQAHMLYVTKSIENIKLNRYEV